MEIAGIKIDELDFEDIGSWPAILRWIVIAFACGITIFLGYLLDWSDKIVSLSAAQDKEAAIRILFSDTQLQVANLETYKSEVKEVEKNLSKLTEQLPSKNEEAGLLEDISQEAVSNGLQLVTIRPGKQENKGFYQENPIELTVTGNANGFGAFVSKVSNMNRIVTFHEFSIKKNDTGGKGALMMVVVAKTYWATGKR
ncbi:MAG TPA: type 4a pilus biogenesis protein PilO [Gammaproteobacteria bacterium]|nr:type 4a pilus biogenesis protein PilO [Gammaproteobacteria bacterium]